MASWAPSDIEAVRHARAARPCGTCRYGREWGVVEGRREPRVGRVYSSVVAASDPPVGAAGSAGAGASVTVGGAGAGGGAPPDSPPGAARESRTRLAPRSSPYKIFM